MSAELDTKQICSELQSEDYRQRCRTLLQLTEHCAAAPANTSVEAIAGDFDELYLHLLKCYGDRFEKVRSQAVQAVSAFMQSLPPLDFHLLNVVSTLAERMGQTETVEQSEEIRLLYIQQLRLMLQKYAQMGNAGVLRECYEQVVQVLNKSIRDAYAAVQREGCATLVELTTVASTHEFQPYTETLAIALYSMLNHRHAPARIAAVQALAHLSLHMNASGDSLKRLIGEVSPLLMDNMPLVRRECGQMGVLMLLQLKDRYSYFERILPLVLCCLKDDSPEVLAYIQPRWLQCGKQYYDENEAELAQQEIADLPVANYPADVERPSIGCRGLVQRSLRLLALITRECSDWKDNVRLHSLKLLYQFVLHAEASMTAKFFEAYPHVATACCDAETSVAAAATKVADLMGRLLSYDAWIEHGLHGLERNARESYLKCFYYMFDAAQGGNYEQLLRLASLLKCVDYAHTLKPSLQLYILKMLHTLLRKSTELNAALQQLQQLYALLYATALKVMGLAYSLPHDSAEHLKLGEQLLEQLAALEATTVEQLHERWLLLALLDVQNLDAALDEQAEPVLLLNGLINLAGIRASCLPQLIAQVQLVFAHCSSSAQLHIFSTLSIVSLKWSHTVRVEREQRTQLLSNFVQQLVAPYLAWSAGGAAEAMRSVAMATTCALAQGAELEMREILPTLAKHMPSLLEDHNVATRHYAIKAICYFQGLSVAELKPLAYATMQRLDDPAAGIRNMAAIAVAKLQPVFNSELEPEPAAYEREVWDSFIKRAMDLLLLYHESPEKDMQAAAQSSLMALAKLHPVAWEERYERALSQARRKEDLVELYGKLQIKEEEQQQTNSDD
ncbi:CG31320, partial [Drosophila busckii]